MADNNIGWDAFPYFKDLVGTNKLCQKYGFEVCRVSSLQGFEDVLTRFQTITAFVAVADESDGRLNLNNTGHSHFVKTVFVGMRHPENDQPARAQAFGVIRELCRQLISRLAKERTRIQQGFIYINQDITFSEIPEFFASGCACAFFNVSVGKYCNLAFNRDEWL